MSFKDVPRGFLFFSANVFLIGVVTSIFLILALFFSGLAFNFIDEIFTLLLCSVVSFLGLCIILPELSKERLT